MNLRRRRRCFRRRRRQHQQKIITWADVIPHLRSTLFVTGAFIVAWAWDLVVYSISHIIWGENPLNNQLGFADQPGPKDLMVLLLEYLLVCGGAAAASNYVRDLKEEEEGEFCYWSPAAVMAIEFFPSPVFAGKLMAYLSQFQLSKIEQAVINLAATWVAAFLAHTLPIYLTRAEGPLLAMTPEAGRLLRRTGLIVQGTLGFGLGIAWNVLLINFGPSDHSSLNVFHLLALIAYLCAVLMIAFNLAAIAKDQPSTLWERNMSLLAFAMYVVCGFTLVGFLNAVMHEGWLGALESFLIVLGLAAITSALVAMADLDGMLEDENDAREPCSWEYDSSKFESLGGVLNCLLFLPCFWCCCPYIPILILMAGMSETIGVKEHWFRLIAMVAGLASSIEGSSMLTSTTDYLAGVSGICGIKHCHYPWGFVGLQIILAVTTTVVILPLTARLPPPDSLSNNVDRPPLPSAPTERQALLS